MDAKIREVFKSFLNESLEQIIISKPSQPEVLAKVKIRPVQIKKEIKFQVTEYRGTKVFHVNHTQGEMLEMLPEYFEGQLAQAELKGADRTGILLIGRKGVTVKCKKRADAHTAAAVKPHNAEKLYILQEGMKIPFLIDLGVMTESGKIVRARYDKFRQINRYLELVEDILPELPGDREVSIVDFGCGKSYLTFALYYYLREIKGYNIKITGLDLKEDVINFCKGLRDRYGYEKLEFIQGDIADYVCSGEVDMVVTLHACDTATDYALAKAVSWGAKIIFCVPCCQHELNRQIINEMLAPVLKYGIIKERMSSLITDALRAGMLEEQGYRTQILEFVDMEHTPKNILIRAVKKGGVRGTADYLRCMEELGVSPTLFRLLHEVPDGTD